MLLRVFRLTSGASVSTLRGGLRVRGGSERDEEYQRDYEHDSSTEKEGTDYPDYVSSVCESLWRRLAGVGFVDLGVGVWIDALGSF